MSYSTYRSNTCEKEHNAVIIETWLYKKESHYMNLVTHLNYLQSKHVLRFLHYRLRVQNIVFGYKNMCTKDNNTEPYTRLLSILQILY